MSNPNQKPRSRMAFLAEMQRYSSEGWIAGVCAGIADYFGWKVKLVRLVAFLLLVFTAGTVVFAIYVAFWFLMDDGNIHDPNRPTYEKGIASAAFTASGGASNFSASPAGGGAGTGASSSSEIRERFVKLDARMRQMEEAALSKDAALAREFNKLERDSQTGSA